jgi:signal transduction histidine kinase
VRRRLTIVILGVVLGTLILTVGASVLLVQGAAISTGEGELTPEAQALGQLINTSSVLAVLRVGTILRQVGGFDSLTVVGVNQKGAFDKLPSLLQPQTMDPKALIGGETVTGNVGREIFVAVPLTLTERKLLALGLPASDQAVLVITRRVKSPVNGVGYFLLVAGIVLIIGAAVAALVARRISAPLVDAVNATGKIAHGDLSARVPVGPRDYPELAALADSINTMGESLARSEGLERQFLLSVSHELRTPLTSIRGYADALSDGTTADVAGAVAIIGAEARRLERLVEDLLDLARLDARQFSFRAEKVDCADVVTAVAVGFAPQVESSSIELQTYVASDEEDASPGLWVSADPDRIGQVVANLVENALKFAFSRVVIGTGTVGTSIVIWVVDDGPGIAAQDLPHVFERHFSSDRVPSRKLGTGLGLAIVAELTEAMGSRCTAESPVAEGRGTRMTVWLRPAPAPAPSAGGPQPGHNPADVSR